MSKSKNSSKLTTLLIENINESIELLLNRCDIQEILDLLFDFYVMDKEFYEAMNDNLKNEKLIQNDKNASLYLKTKKNTIETNEKGKAKWDQILKPLLIAKKYTESKRIAIAIIQVILNKETPDLVNDYLKETKDINDNDEYLQKGFIYIVNGLIYRIINSSFERIEYYYKNINTIIKILNLQDPTTDYFESCVSVAYEKEKLEIDSKDIDLKIQKYEETINQKIKENELIKIESEKELTKQLNKEEKLKEKISELRKNNKELTKELEKFQSIEGSILSQEGVVKEENLVKENSSLTAQIVEMGNNEKVLRQKLEELEKQLKEKNKQIETIPVVVEPEKPLVDKKPVEFDENKFINTFISKIREHGLCYDKQDLCNFHVACKSSPLVILAGASGMGKTQLPMVYAECINASEDNGRLLFIPISPSYTEPSDVLGFYHSKDEKYVPSETGLVDLLRHAETNKDEMHMVIFDEMNLSQIEYWFAPFMSILEKPKDKRMVQLYSKTLEENTNNMKTYPATIKLYDNIIFVGTINLDETTKDMSDRLIDRSIVINLNKQKFVDYMNQAKSDDGKVAEECICKSMVEFNSMRENIEENYITTLSDDEIKFFDKLHDTFQNSNASKCVSFRNVKKIAMYLNGAKHIEGFARQIAFDYIFKQTILKKINGYDESIKEILGTLDDKDELINSKLMEVLKSANKVSKFEKTREEIIRKIKEFNNYGYTR